MKYVFVDMETYYDSEYSLRKMTPIEYVLDPRFELIGCAVAENNEDPKWIDGPDFKAYLKTLNPTDTVLISHNALFDMTITSWLYSFVSKLMIDTMGMARATLQHKIKNGSVALRVVADALGLPPKGDFLKNVSGMNRAAIIAAGYWEQYTGYGLNDVMLCREIYYKLRPLFPASEIVLNDTIIRCAITPKFKLDQNTLALHAHNIKQEKDLLLTKTALAGLDGKADLMSNEKFAHALRSLGVEPPLKVSKLTGKQTYAFAKTDHAMIELEEHPNPAVQALIAARLGHKSTLEETRTAKFLKIAQLTIPGKEQGLMPMPLRYGGAHTHRLSGDWKLNVQNLTRGSKLREALKATSSHKVLACDASQIEARIAAWLCGQDDLVEQFRRGDDTYSIFATDVYGRPITKSSDPLARWVGKTAILGLGFGMGAPRFESQVKSDSHKQGIVLTGMDIGEATRIVGIFRSKYPNFKITWNYLQNMLGEMTHPDCDVEWGPVRFQHQSILLPSGLRIHYHNLRYETSEDGSNWVYDYGREKRKLFGGKVLENIVQALARIITMDAALRNRKLLSLYDIELALQVHDELVYVVPDELVNVTKQVVYEEMKRPPVWASDLPLDAEVGVGDNYGECK